MKINRTTQHDYNTNVTKDQGIREGRVKEREEEGETEHYGRKNKKINKYVDINRDTER